MSSSFNVLPSSPNELASNLFDVEDIENPSTTSSINYEGIVLEPSQIAPSDCITPENNSNNLEELIFKKLLHHFCKPNTPLSNALEISQMVIEIMDFTTTNFREGIRKCSSLDEARRFADNTEIDDSKFRSIHMFKKHLEEADVLFHPKTFVIKEKSAYYGEDVSEEITTNSYQGIVMPIKKQIQKILELPGMLSAILKIQEQFQHASSEEIQHFCQGKLWKNIVSKNIGKTLIPVMLYSDDFTIDNSIGPHSQDNQICGFYYQFLSFPSHLKSKLQYIFVAMLTFTKHMKECSPDSSLHILVQIFSDLERNGIEVSDEKGKIHKIHIILTNFQGDNLGIHVICGFTTGFNSEFYCRFCFTRKAICQYLSENKNLDPRTVER